MKNPLAKYLEQKLRVLQSNFSLGLMLVGGLAEPLRPNVDSNTLSCVMRRNNNLRFLITEKQKHTLQSGKLDTRNISIMIYLKMR